MTQGLLPWSPCHHSLSPTSLFALPLAFPTTKNTQFPVSISATLEPEPATSTTQQLTARERRQLRNERRERKAGTSWKEEVEASGEAHEEEIHDFIRECDGVAGSVGSKVGNTKRQITKPRPVSEFDMEAIFKQERKEQQKAEQAFEQEQQEATLNDAAEFDGDSKPKKRPRKTLDPLINGSSKGKSEKLVPGSSVRVVSGTFAEYVGSLKKLNKRTKKVCFSGITYSI
ncbi:unnamed protein product [Malus baccata var. baccata]